MTMMVNRKKKKKEDQITNKPEIEANTRVLIPHFIPKANICSRSFISVSIPPSASCERSIPILAESIVMMKMSTSSLRTPRGARAQTLKEKDEKYGCGWTQSW